MKYANVSMYEYANENRTSIGTLVHISLFRVNV